MIKKFLLIILAFTILSPFSVLAFQEISAGTNLIAEVKPTSPGAGDQVTINLSGYGFDLNTSIISWYIDTNLRNRGLGVKSLTFSLGPVGTQTKVSVYVQAEGGQKASKTFIFDPTELELFWETKTSHPPFYKGKALPSPGSTIKITALPYVINRAGQKIDPTKLSYTWRRDGAVLSNLSGIGKNSISLVAGKTSTQVKVGVEAKSVTDNITANRELILNLVSPEILFYEEKPLEGINYGKTLPKEYSLFEDEVTVRAEPYFLPVDKTGDYRYSWKIDRAGAQGRTDDPRAITLRQSPGVSGSNLINFLAENINASVSNSFIIKYGNGLLKTLQ